MKVLGLDTTRKKACLYIFDTEKNIDYRLELDEKLKHSESLFLYIEKALTECDLQLNDFDYFACVVGPGSFTGIRVGLSVIKGFKKVYDKNVVTFNSFEFLKYGIKNGYILLNSTINSVYYSEIKDFEIVESGVIDKLNLECKIKNKKVYVLEDEQNLIGFEYNNVNTIDDLTNKFKKVLFDKIDKKDFEDIVPYYLQLSQAERNIKDA